MSEWRTIETAPLVKDDPIMLCDVRETDFRRSGPTVGWFAGRYYEGGVPVWQNGMFPMSIEATHWMPLPALPTSTKGPPVT